MCTMKILRNENFACTLQTLVNDQYVSSQYVSNLLVSLLLINDVNKLIAFTEIVLFICF